MDDLTFLFNEFSAPAYQPTEDDLQEYYDYLDAQGYDHDDDDWDEDPDSDRGFQPFQDSPF